MHRPLLKFLLIMASLGVDSRMYIDRISKLDSPLKVIAYCLIYLGFAAALICAANIRKGALRWTFAALLAGAAILTTAYRHTTEEELGYFNFVTLLDSRSAMMDVLATFPVPLLIASGAALLLFIGLELAPKPRPLVSQWFAIGVPITSLIALTGLLSIRGGEGAGGLPPSWPSLAYTPIYAAAVFAGSAGERKPVSIARDGLAPAHDIVVIVDESVSGNYLDINMKEGVRSGLANPPERVAAYNFGMAAAIANCSINSNVTLRFGGTRSDYRRIIATEPSIWSYAKTAGMRTISLYAQRKGMSENYMSDDERKDIDQQIWFEEFPDIDRDMAVAKEIAGFLNNDRAEFIYVNKLGAHFPVHASYPESFARYGPVLPRETRLAESATGDIKHEQIIGRAGDWVAYRNAYRNTLTWKVGAFFDALFAQAKINGATIIYTSDHGQTLHERGNPGLTTHCQSKPEIEEGVVPLVLITGKRDIGPDWKNAAARGFNKMSGFRIFPTLLTLMGYKKEAVFSAYGPSLESNAPDPFTFGVQMSIKPGMNPRWIHIPIDQIVSPPVSDIKTRQ